MASSQPASPSPVAQPPPHIATVDEYRPKRVEQRTKPLKITVGTPPARLDIGSEADLLGISSPEEQVIQQENWNFNMKGYIRVPMRIGYGPKNDGTPGNEMHSPPRMVGLSSGDWEYLNIAPNPALSIYANFGNPVVSANIIYGSSAVYDAGYDSLDNMGGIRMAYVTLKYPDAFGTSGGLSMTAGAFSNRYGSPGRTQVSSGYYGTYLFGRTHATGEIITADIDLSKDLELVLEHGVGAKLEVIPFVADTPRTPGGSPEADYFKGTGPVPQGSNFLHHAHAGLFYRGWLMIAAHYLTSWSPDDNHLVRDAPQEEARMTVTGAEIHVDDEALGNGFIGFSHLDGKNLLALGDAVQVLHGSDGRGIKEEYFGGKERLGASFTPTNNAGTLDTLIFQHLFHLASQTDRLPFGAQDVTLALYTMLNHAKSPKTNPNDPLELEIDNWMIKYGAEVSIAPFKYVNVGLRADHVQPCWRCRRGAPDAPGEPPSFVTDSSDAFTALTPRLILHTTWKTKEYVTMSYTRFFLGPNVYPSSPYSDYTQSDPHLFLVAVNMSF